MVRTERHEGSRCETLAKALYRVDPRVQRARRARRWRYRRDARTERFLARAWEQASELAAEVIRQLEGP